MPQKNIFDPKFKSREYSPLLLPVFVNLHIRGRVEVKLQEEDGGFGM